MVGSIRAVVGGNVRTFAFCYVTIKLVDESKMSDILGNIKQIFYKIG